MLFGVFDLIMDYSGKNTISAFGGYVKGKISNPNLLINPNFKINQRVVTGTFSNVGEYFVDRWILESGSVTVNDDSTITIDGTITQFCEVDKNCEDFIGSVSNSVSSVKVIKITSPETGFTGIVQLEITAENTTISWAKLECGNVATSFIPPNITTEQLKCQRYYLGLNKYIRYPMTRRATNDIDFIIPTNAMFRATPMLIGDPVVYNTNNTTAQPGFTFSIVSYGINAIAIRATKTNHGLTSAYLEVTNGVSLSAEI